MKAITAILTIACAAAAASIPEGLIPREALAICNAHRGESCSRSGIFACEHNGGHSMFCVESSGGNFNWIYADNCPDSHKHCNCATGRCVA